MMRCVRPFTALLLALVLTVTSVSMAVARGQTTPVGMMVLCAGGVAQIVPVDAEGQPTGPAHLCPDCALTLFDAPGQTGPILSYGAHWRRLSVPMVHVVVAGQSWPVPPARGPPAFF